MSDLRLHRSVWLFRRCVCRRPQRGECDQRSDGGDEPLIRTDRVMEKANTHSSIPP
jgi:hypothetical protein